MVLKFKTNSRYYANGSEDFQDNWCFMDGIAVANIYYDKSIEATVAVLEFDSKPSIKVALNDEAYLLNENGKTIEKVGG